MAFALLATPVSHVRATVRALRGEGRGWILVAVAAGWLLTLGMRFLLPAILPQIKAAFAIDNATAGAAITVIWACYALMQFPAGVLVDRYGERFLLTASLCLAGVSLGLLSAAPVFLAFLGASAAFGLGTGLFGPPRGTTLSNVFRQNAGAAFGVTLAAGSLGSAALPLVGSLLVSDLGWRLTLALSIPFFLGIAALTWRVVPTVTTDAPDATGRLDRETVAAIRAGISTRPVAVSAAAIMLLLFIFQGLTAFLPTYFIAEKGLSQGTAATLFALLFVSGAAFQLLAGGAADRYGAKPVLIAIAGVGVPALAVLPSVGGVGPLAVVTVVLGSRMAIGPVTNAYIIDALPDAVQGSSWGLLRSGFFLVGATGSTFVGVFADAGLFDEVFLLLAGLTALATVLYLALPGQT